MSPAPQYQQADLFLIRLTMQKAVPVMYEWYWWYEWYCYDITWWYGIVQGIVRCLYKIAAIVMLVSAWFAYKFYRSLASNDIEPGHSIIDRTMHGLYMLPLRRKRNGL